MKKLELNFICEELNLEEEILLSWINCQLVQPADVSGPSFDEEDFSRIRLISEIHHLYSTNEESLKIIIHLIDQIHLLNSEFRKINKTS